MSNSVINVENLGKQYIIGSAGRRSVTFREMLVDTIYSPIHRLKKLQGSVSQDERFWALREINFQMHPGEVLGIIGRNGAGKSTLLKLLSRVTSPSEGRIEIRGRVASLLEVGTGFHPELTGRENIYLNGTILGMTRREINEKFAAIAEFAEVEKFLDTPVKRYSSGMYVRLAFSIAAHLEPDILIVDEVLAVGDAEFQKKCLGKMELDSQDGRTVLFVSHNMGAVKSLCHRAIVLNGGRVQIDADVDNAVSYYLNELDEQRQTAGEWIFSEQEASGGDQVKLLAVYLKDTQARTKGHVSPDETFEIWVVYRQHREMPGMRALIQLVTPMGEVAFTGTDSPTRKWRRFQPGMYRSRCRIPGGLLNTGRYFLRVWFSIGGAQRLFQPLHIGGFNVSGEGNQGTWLVGPGWPGVVCPKLEWEIDVIERSYS